MRAHLSREGAREQPRGGRAPPGGLRAGAGGGPCPGSATLEGHSTIPVCRPAPWPRSHLLALLALLLHGSGGGPGPPRGIPARVSGGASARSSGGGGHGPPGSCSSPASRSRSRSWSHSRSRRRLRACGSAPPPSWAAPSRDVIAPPPGGDERSAPAPDAPPRKPRPHKPRPAAVNPVGRAHRNETPPTDQPLL